MLVYSYIIDKVSLVHILQKCSSGDFPWWLHNISLCECKNVWHKYKLLFRVVDMLILPDVRIESGSCRLHITSASIPSWVPRGVIMDVFLNTIFISLHLFFTVCHTHMSLHGIIFSVCESAQCYVSNAKVFLLHWERYPLLIWIISIFRFTIWDCFILSLKIHLWHHFQSEETDEVYVLVNNSYILITKQINANPWKVMREGLL